MSHVGIQDVHLHEFCFVLGPKGCMEEVGQSGQPFHH